MRWIYPLTHCYFQQPINSMFIIYLIEMNLHLLNSIPGMENFYTAIV